MAEGSHQGDALRVAVLTAITMVAFAANSILNRQAVDSGAADPAGFAFVRVLTGAVVLVALVTLKGGRVPLKLPRRVYGAAALSVYMIGFSAAYVSLDAGLGALILFGVVQIAMFGYSALTGAGASSRQVAGAVVAFGGLCWILWPAADGPEQVEATSFVGAALMIAAGLGWAAYSLIGRGESDPLSATAGNFCLALIPTALFALWAFDDVVLSPAGLMLAALSGGVTSGLGYALWYNVLPRLSPQAAATVQLSVPVIALAAGVVLLGERADTRLVLGAGIVLGGIALALRKPAGK